MPRGLVVALSLAACVQRTPFQCQANEQCVWEGRSGTCEPNEFCSFPDTMCASGRRYADLAGELSGQCVDQTGDGGVFGPDAVTQVVPSNGVDPSLVNGAHADLEVLDGENWVIDTDTGAIIRCGGAVVRPAGEGNIGGIRLALLPSATGGVPLAVFAVDSLTIETSGQLYAVGDHALVLLVRNAVSVAGVLDVSGGDRACDLQATCGMAAGNRTCGGPGGFAGGVAVDGQGPGAGKVDPAQVHGSGGGAFAGRGGAAGGSMAAPAGGAPYGQARLIPLIGGSGGGGYAVSSATDLGGGGGGGALQITALGMIEISSAGRVAAAGVGGAAGGGGGGAGGGAGGAILFEAPSLAIAGRLTANGGGGGGTGDASAAGTAGTFGPNPAPGGAGLYRGGAGGARITPDGQKGEPAGDAVYTAGGGGGAGRIVLRGSVVTPTGDISPEALVLDDLYVVP